MRTVRIRAWGSVVLCLATGLFMIVGTDGKAVGYGVVMLVLAVLQVAVIRWADRRG